MSRVVVPDTRTRDNIRLLSEDDMKYTEARLDVVDRSPTVVLLTLVVFTPRSPVGIK